MISFTETTRTKRTANLNYQNRKQASLFVSFLPMGVFYIVQWQEINRSLHRSLQLHRLAHSRNSTDCNFSFPAPTVFLVLKALEWILYILTRVNNEISFTAVHSQTRIPFRDITFCMTHGNAFCRDGITWYHACALCLQALLKVNFWHVLHSVFINTPEGKLCWEKASPLQYHKGLSSP